LPEIIERAIDREAAAAPGKALAHAAEALSLRYRDRPHDPLPHANARAAVPPPQAQSHARRQAQPPQREERTPTREPARTRRHAPPLSEVERLAYAVVRAPATYVAVAAVLRELGQRAPDMRLASLLDLGAGPGAATWAARAQRPELARVTLIERDPGFIDLGRRILDSSASVGADADADVTAGADAAADAIANASAASAAGCVYDWQCADLRAAMALPAHDLVIMSYALGELDAVAARQIVERAWAATRQALIVIEPGTPRHFAGVLAARDTLLHAGACIAAPCPHADACPMTGTTDWCHMAARLERTSLHRRLKSAALPYEDEKFSYVIATREPVTRAAARIIRRPEIQKGFISLALCTPAGLTRDGVTRSRGDAFRRARKADWGDAWSAGAAPTADESVEGASASVQRDDARVEREAVED
jgi:ribosomal protein RSM22 (predicted rRNA methylase)